MMGLLNPARLGLAMVLGAVAALTVGTSAWAQDYPTRTVRVMVGFPPG